MRTTVILPGNFLEKQAKRIKEKMQGLTYMEFDIEYSNMHGNYNILVSSDRLKGLDKAEAQQELLEMFYYVALTEL